MTTFPEVISRCEGARLTQSKFRHTKKTKNFSQVKVKLKQRYTMDVDLDEKMKTITTKLRFKGKAQRISANSYCPGNEGLPPLDGESGL